ncbi:MAG: hypothetical protein WC587_02225 [Candidatus Paceibacterota bacterium]
MQKKYLIIGLLIFLVLFIIIANTKKQDTNNGETIRPKNTATLSDEWSQPIALSLNSNLWEDGAYISGDGKTLYYAIYPGEDLINDFFNNDFKGDIDVYYSEYPFEHGEKHTLSKKPWSEGGVMISGNDIYYHSNKPVNNNDKNYDTNIYKNDELLSFNSEVPQDDPHYCSKLDELYFWSENQIFVFRNNKVEKLSSPINKGEENIQPFLTPDCQTMYFTSKRDNDQVPKIYKSNKISDNNWSEPEIVVSGKFGVGEPTLTDDGIKLFFVQIFRSDEGKYSSDIYYAMKK